MKMIVRRTALAVCTLVLAVILPTAASAACTGFDDMLETADCYLKEHQKDFMPEDTKAGLIQAFLDSYTGDTACSKQLYKEALNHAFDEPKQWEIREINEIMNQCVTGWTYFSNPRSFAGYGRQKGWEREKTATGSGNQNTEIPDGFVEITEQMELPF